MDPILTQDAAAQRFDYLSSLPLAKLKQEQEKEKAAGSYTPQTQGLYEALASDKVDKITAQWDALPSKQIAHEFERGLADGEYDESLAPVAQEAFSKKFKEERDTSGLDKTGKFLGSAASMVGNEIAAPFTDRESQVVKPFVKGVAKSLRDVVVGTNYLGLGNLGSGVPVEEQQKASDRLFSGAEFGTRQTAGLVKDIFDHEADNQYAAKGDAALEDIFAARRAEQKSLVDAARGAGSLVTHSGAAAPADFNAQDRADVQEMSQALDATNMIPVGGGFKIGASGISRAVRGIAKSAGIDVLERGAEAVSKTLGGALETGPKRQVLGTPLMTAEEALIRQASTDGLLRKARLAAGRGTVALGETIQKAAKALPAASSTGVAAAGLTLAAGGDAQEALTAGLASLVGRKIIGGKLGLKGLGAGLESAGRVMQKTLPTPFSKTQAAINAFRSEYRPIKSALAAAGLGAAETGLLSLGADSPEEAGGIVGGGATLGALGSGLGTLKAFGRDQLVKNAAGVTGETAKTAVPVEPLGLDPEADKINAEAVKQLTPAGSVFLQTARAMLPDQHVYVAMTGDQAQSIYTRLTGDQTDVRNVNGLTAPTKDGKQLVLIRPAGVDAGITGEAGGHEVTHALKAIGEADPKTRGAWLVVEDEARKALGPAGSEVFEGVRDQYQSQMPEGTKLSDQQVVDEFIAEHGSVLLSGLPAGKLGGNKGLSNALSSAFFRLAENAGLRKVGFARDGTEPVTSSTLPYTPSFNLLDALEHAINASRLEASDLVPDASVPVEPPKPAVSKPAVAPETSKAPPTFNAGEGILKPIPTTLATDQSLGTATPPQQPIAPKPETAKAAPEPRDFLYTVQKGEGNVPGYVQIDDVTDKANRESGSLEKFRERGYDLPDVPESLPQGQYTLDQIKEAVAKEKASAPPTKKSVNGALRGQEVQAARTESVAPLSPIEEKQLKDAQPDVAKQDVARKVWESVKALGGQRIGLPVFEAAVNQDGVVRSKRVAPYSIEVSSSGKVTVLTVDMDRANYNGKLLFDWAAAQGTPERFGYTGITDPKFVADLGTYLRNQAEGRRGSGETLTAEGIPPATGKPVGTLTREQEQFFNILMGQTPPKELTTRSALAIARIRATAMASGIEPIKTEGGSVEPNALRDALRKEGAPIDRIGEDPDLTRRQSNPKDRNSVIARIRLQDFESLTPTGQSVSQPNTRAIEASFMPPASRADAKAPNEEVRKIARQYMSDNGIDRQTHEKAIPVNEDLAKKIADFYEGAVDNPTGPAEQRAYKALASETVKQWKAFEKAGYTAEPWTGEGQPYANSAEMMKDVRDNKHLFYFKTEGGFGSEGISAKQRAENPMLASSDVNFGAEKNVPVNDVFRVVHDLVTHAAHGFEFGPKGEFNAYLSHSKMFSDEAKPALAAETLSQNSWVNYGPHLRDENGRIPQKGEPGFVAPADRKFADQKNVVVPPELLKQADAYADAAKFMPASREDFSKENIDGILNKTGWAIFSAENPGNKELSPRENSIRNTALEKELRQKGYDVIPVKGRYNRDENSFIVTGISADEAKRFGAKHGQESILTASGLEYSDGRVAPAEGVNVHATKPEDFFTTLPDGTHFSVKLGDPLPADSVEVQSLKASEAAENAVVRPNFQPAGKTDSPEFKKWFAGSSIKNEDGTPKRVFHTTVSAGFDKFRRSASDIGIHFGDAGQAEDRFQYKTERGNRSSDGAGTIAAYIQLKNPLRLSDSGSWSVQDVLRQLDKKGEFTGTDLASVANKKDLLSLMKRKGFDGIVYKNTGESSDPTRAADLRNAVRVARQAVDAEFGKNKSSFSVEDQKSPAYREYSRAMNEEAAFRNEEGRDSFIVFEPSQIKSAISPTFDPKDSAKFMPSLKDAKVKTPDTQFKRERPLKGAKGGVLDIVHFSSKDLKQIDPAKSFGKGAATQTDMMGAPKAFFYAKGTAYEAPIAGRSNVYTAKVDGNSIYDLNTDALGVQSIVNREKRDQAIKDAGFKGFYVETPGFDAVAIYDKIDVTPSSKEDVMTTRQMKALGIETPAERKRREKADELEYARFQRVGVNEDGTPRFMPAKKDALGLYSQLEKTLDAIPEKASRQQIEAALRDGVKEKGVLKERPVKQEELADVKDQNGVSFSEYLKANPDATRQDLIDFARAADVKVDEVVKGGDERYRLIENTEETEYQGDGTVMYDVVDTKRPINGNPRVMFTGDEASAKDYVEETRQSQPETQYEDYQLPGGENYREVVLTLPDERPQVPAIDVVHASGGSMVINLDTRETLKKGLTRDEAIRFAEAKREELTAARGNPRAGVGYESSHFKDTPNYLAHARFNERTTPEGKVFFVEEIQSDLHQAGRKKGYVKDISPVERASLEMQQEAAVKERQAFHEEYRSMLKEHDEVVRRAVETGKKVLVDAGLVDAAEVSNGTILEMLRGAKSDAKDKRLVEARKELDASQDKIDAAAAKRQRLMERTTELSDVLTGVGGTPDAPFKKSWPEMVFKTLLNKAAQSGSDFIAWTTGEQQAARYDLSKQVDAVLVTKDSLGGYNVQVKTPGNRGYRGVASGLEAPALEDHVGKELAQKAVADLADKKQAEYTGLDLKVGGEGMKGFYDKILPSLVDKYAKKWGVKTETMPLDMPVKNARDLLEASLDDTVVHALRITPEMRKDILENGQPRYMPAAEQNTRTGDLSKVRVVPKEQQDEDRLAKAKVRRLSSK